MQNDQDKLANNVVSHMMEYDLFSQWLGIEVMEIREGYSKIKMTVRRRDDQRFWYCAWRCSFFFGG